MTALSQQLALRLMLARKRCRASQERWASLAYWLPRSECTTKPAGGCRWEMAIGKAVQISSAGMLGAIAQPTILRENKSITAARYNQPLAVRMSVMSETQAQFAVAGSNCRLSRLSAIGRAWRRSVVWTNLRFQTGRRPLIRLSDRTR